MRAALSSDHEPARGSSLISRLFVGTGNNEIRANDVRAAVRNDFRATGVARLTEASVEPLNTRPEVCLRLQAMPPTRHGWTADREFDPAR